MTRYHKDKTESLFVSSSLLFSLFFLEIACSRFLSSSHSSSLSAPRGAHQSWHVSPGFAARLQGNICCCFQLSHCLAKILLCSMRQLLPHITYSLKTQQRGRQSLILGQELPHGHRNSRPKPKLLLVSQALDLSLGSLHSCKFDT